MDQPSSSSAAGASSSSHDASSADALSRAPKRKKLATATDANSRKQDEYRRRIAEIRKNMTEEELDRFDAVYSTILDREFMKNLVSSMTGSKASDEVMFAISGVAKLYVGEVVEAALEEQQIEDQTGPLKPEHLRQGFYRLLDEGRVLSSVPRPIQHFRR
jgi:transcription initiation factor TFIID subunit 11